MTKKESEKDSDRPHYYSQFWLDVAAGRRVIGAPRTEEGEADEEPMPVSPRRSVYSTEADGYHEEVVHPRVEQELDEDADEYSTPELEPFEDVEAEEIGDEDEGLLAPVFGANEDDIPDVDFSPKTEAAAVRESDEVDEVEPEENEEEFFDEEVEDDEEDDTWAARGRK